MKNKKNVLRFFTFLSLFFTGIFSLSSFAFALTVSHSVTAGKVDSGGGVLISPFPVPITPTPIVTPITPVPVPAPLPVVPLPSPIPVTPTPTPAPIPIVPTPGPTPITPPVPPVVISPVEKIIINISTVIVEKTKEFIKSPIGQVVTKTAKTVGVASGAALILSQAVLSTATATITSLSDIYLMLVRFSGLFFGVSRRRKKPWGTVYDSVTKRPLDPAYVMATKANGEEVADAITDLDGRYGFLIPPDLYKLKAQKTNYSFPTKKLENITHDEIYDNIYHEEILDVKEGDVIVKNIPLDPIGFDWNEFEKNKQNLFRIYSDRERFWNKLFNSFYLLGILSAIAVALFDPTSLNFFLLFIYLLFIAHQAFGKKHKAVSLKRENGEPIPFAVIKVMIPEIDTKIRTAIADHLGRFYFIVAPGKYYLTIDQKNHDGTYTMIRKTDIIDLKNGVMTKDILI